MRVLIVRLSAIGDVVHTLPALLALHRAGHEVGWVAEPAARPLLQAHPLLAELIAAPAAKAFAFGPAAEAVRALRAGRWDVALDFQGLWKSAAWAALSGARAIGFESAARREPASALLLAERHPLPAAAVHVIDKNLALLGALGIDALGAREFPLPAAPAAEAAVAEQLASRRLGRFALLNPGGGWTSKLWPAGRWAELARLLDARGVPSLVAWGPGEGRLADEIAASSRGAATPAFPTSLLEYVALARQAAVVVAADTGPLHLACAVGAPVVALFGPTDPARNGPFSPADRVVRRVPPCAPCHRRDCPEHAGVMATIPAGEVAEAALLRIAGEEALHARPL
ncbi:MAG: glycosyltransferase family 9 protein [Vicinamibacteria bacterium]|nr:glycosyltransferase family 9 protein [Vicinamibacteria bacterium]